MFDIFRKHTKIMMILLFLLIIPSFVLFGIDGYNRSQNSDEAVARVGSVEITRSQWEGAHKAEVDRLRAAQPDIDVKLLDTPMARDLVLDRLIQEAVMTVAADQFELLTSDARLARFLQEDPAIASLRQADGRLDLERYRQLAASQGYTPEGFENMVRRTISRQQVDAAVRQSVIVNQAAADLALGAFFEEREVQTANFPSSNYLAGLHPTDADLQAYFQSHASEFVAPEYASIQYVVLDMASVKKTITIADADLKSYYEQNVAKLSGKEERRASHILIAADKASSEADKARARSRAEELLATVRKSPEKFAELARKNSQDPGSAAKGGDLDFFARGAMVKPFEDAVFRLKRGEISDVVESDFGFHIIQLTELKEPKQRSYEELRPIIEEDLKTQQAQRRFAEVAEVFTNMVYEQADSLQPVADKLGLAIETAERVTREPAQAVTGVLANPKFLAALFAADSIGSKRNTEAIEVAPNQLVSGRIIAHNPQRPMGFDEVRQKVQEQLVALKAAELARQDGAAKLKQWQADPVKAVLSSPGIVSRQKSNGAPAKLVAAVMTVDPSKLPAWIGVDLDQSGYAVVRVNKVNAPDVSTRPSLVQDRAQVAQWWSAAQATAYFLTLKEALKVEVLIQRPAARSPA